MSPRRLVVAATSGAPFGLGLAVVAYCLLLGLVVPTDGLQPGLADPVNLLLTATLYIAPLGAGTGAFHAQQLRKSSLLDVAATTSRGPRAALLLAWLTVVLWQLVAVAALGVVLMSRADLGGAVTAPMLLAALQPPLVVLAGSALGAHVGARSGFRLTPALCAIGVFAVLYLVALADGLVHRFSPVLSEIYCQTFLEPDPRRTGAMLVLLVGTTVALLVLLPTGPGRRRRVVPTTVAAALVVVGVAGTAAYGDEPVRVRTTGETVCAGADGTELCVWEESQARLAPTLRRIVEVRDVVGGAFPTPDTYAEPGAGPRDALRVTPAGADDPDPFLAIVLALVPVSGCSDAGAQRAAGDLVQWLRLRLEPDAVVGEPTPRLADVLDRSAADQEAWAGERFAEASAGCRRASF